MEPWYLHTLHGLSKAKTLNIIPEAFVNHPFGKDERITLTARENNKFTGLSI